MRNNNIFEILKECKRSRRMSAILDNVKEKRIGLI